MHSLTPVVDAGHLLGPRLGLSARTPTCGLWSCLASSKHGGWVPNRKSRTLLRPGPRSRHRCAANSAIFCWSNSHRAQIQGARPDSDPPWQACQRTLGSHLKLHTFTEIHYLVFSLYCSCIKIKVTLKFSFHGHLGLRESRQLLHSSYASLNYWRQLHTWMMEITETGFQRTSYTFLIHSPPQVKAEASSKLGSQQLQQQKRGRGRLDAGGEAQAVTCDCTFSHSVFLCSWQCAMLPGRDQRKADRWGQADWQCQECASPRAQAVPSSPSPTPASPADASHLFIY